jgi:hypothetical protein
MSPMKTVWSWSSAVGAGRGPSTSGTKAGLATCAAGMALGLGVDMVVAPERVCPKWMTGALKLKFGGIRGGFS